MTPDTSQALCRPYHSDFFFPPVFVEERTGKESEYYEVAKYICEHGPISDWCRSEGAEEEFGVWGGTTPRERRKGRIKQPTKVLPVEHLIVIPAPAPNDPVNIQCLRIAWCQR